MIRVLRFGPKSPFALLAGLLVGGATLCIVEAVPLHAANGKPANEKRVSVTLALDDAGNPVAINAPDPDPVHLSRGKGHVAHWYLDSPVDGRIRIVMSDETKPFKQHPKSNGKDAVSDPPELGEGDYKYTILVTLKSGKQLPPLDPVIRVDP